MKKSILVILAVLVLAMACAAYANSDNSSDDNGADDSSDDRVDDSADDSADDSENQTVGPISERVNKIKELRDQIQEKRDELKQELQQLREDKRAMWNNTNRVRIAVHALLALENFTGGIGKNVSAIAREFNNSIRARLHFEEQIQNRSAFKRWLWGGERNAAKELLKQVNRTDEMIKKLEMVRAKCVNCSQEVLDLLDEQISDLKDDKERVKGLATKEVRRTGILGWLFRNKD